MIDVASRCTTSECSSKDSTKPHKRQELIDGWMRDIPRPKLVRLDPDGRATDQSHGGERVGEGFTPVPLFCRHELDAPEREPLDHGREGLDLISYMGERLVKQKSAYKAWLEAEAEHRVSRAQDKRTRNHQGQVWTSAAGNISRRTDSHENQRWLAWTRR